MAPAIGVHFGGCLDTFLGAHCFVFVLRSRSVWLMFSWGNCIVVCFCSIFLLLCPLSAFRIQDSGLWAAVRCYLFWAQAEDQERLRCEGRETRGPKDSVQCINIERIDVDVAPAVQHTHTHSHWRTQRTRWLSFGERKRERDAGSVEGGFQPTFVGLNVVLTLKAVK